MTMPFAPMISNGLLRAAAALGARVGIDAGVRVETRYVIECWSPGGILKWRASAKNRVVTVGLNKLLDATFKTGLTTPTWYVGLVGASISDAAITSASATLTSASNPWTSADATRAIIVRGAGAAGADLVTTIATFGTAGSVTLSATAGTTVSGAESTWDARAGDTMASHAPWPEVTAYSNATRPAFTPGTITNGSVDNSGSVAVFNMNVNNTDIFGCFLSDNSTIGGTTGTLYGMAVFGSPGSRRAQSGDTVNATVTLTVAST